jgi:DNA modification methylase
LESRLIEITRSAFVHGRLNIRSCGKEFFPSDSFGKSKRSAGLGSSLQLYVEGLSAPISTDIPTYVNGRPRWFFRERTWVKLFLRRHKLAVGEKLLIKRLSAREYEISKPRNGHHESAHTLFPGIAEGVIVSRSRGSRKNGDSNKLAPEDRPAHDWYRFVLSFPPHLVRNYLKSFGLGNKHCVLDPFCGTGTTLVECKKCGIASVGVEANPMAFFASKTKLDWSVDPDKLLRHARQIAEKAHENLREDGIDDNSIFETVPIDRGLMRSLPPDAAKLLLTNSISPLPLHKVLVLLETLERNAVPELLAHERLALAKVVVYSVSNLHFGPEVGVGPAKSDTPVVAPWLAAVAAMAQDLKDLRRLNQTSSRVVNSDSRNLRASLAPASVDAVITSPPYPNEKDYTRTTRLESVLLGLIRNKQELRSLKRSLVRSNTRGIYKGDDDDTWVADHPEIQRIAQAIEHRRLELKKTSGFERLYHRVTKLYFGGMSKHLREMQRVLKSGAQLAYVVGDQASYLRIMIRTGELIADIAQSLGYEVQRRDVFRTRLATATREQLLEEVVILRWPGKVNSKMHRIHER